MTALFHLTDVQWTGLVLGIIGLIWLVAGIATAIGGRGGRDD